MLRRKIMLVIEVKKEDSNILEELIKQEKEVQLVEPSNLDGDSLIQLFLEMSKITAPIIASIIIANKNSNKITIKKNGVNITMALSKRNFRKAELINYLIEMQAEDADNNESDD